MKGDARHGGGAGGAGASPHGEELTDVLGGVGRPAIEDAEEKRRVSWSPQLRLELGFKEAVVHVGCGPSGWLQGKEVEDSG